MMIAKTAKREQIEKENKLSPEIETAGSHVYLSPFMAIHHHPPPQNPATSQPSASRFKG